MLLYKKGNLLEATEDIICHQCNTEGVFGGGLALQIKNRYAECEQQVISFVNSIEEGNVVGNVFIYHTDSYDIANCFSQNSDFTTNYEAVKSIFNSLLKQCSDNGNSIAMPYLYGCGIASGDWNIVTEIISELSDRWGVDISIYCLEEGDK